jgi:hypothetical protein
MGDMDEDKVFAALGKIVSNAAFMEWLVAQLVAEVRGEGQTYAEDLCMKPGKAMDAFKQVAHDDDDLHALYIDTMAVRETRNRYAHAVAMVAHDGRGRPVYLHWKLGEGEDRRVSPGEMEATAGEIRAVCARLNRAKQQAAPASPSGGLLVRLSCVEALR